jgi:sirohydrochlorin ferrochelatase
VHVLDESTQITGYTAVILLGHGSRAEEANEAMYEVVRRLQVRRPALRLSAAFLEINAPSIPEGIDFHAEAGAERIILLPYFLHLGNHVQRDLPGFMEEGRNRHPHVEIGLSDHLGFHPKLVDIAEERLIDSLPAEELATPALLAT